MTVLTNQRINMNFLLVVDLDIGELVLKNIAANYGISVQEAFDEVIDEHAEHLLDYLTGSTRDTIVLLFIMYNLN